MKRILLITFVLTACISRTAQAQSGEIPIGNWRVHLPYHMATHVVEAGDEIFVGCLNSLWSYNKNDGSRKTVYAKSDGFSSINQRGLGYSTQEKTLVIGYENGDIDLVKDGEIINIPEVKNAGSISNKNLNSIRVFGERAILCYDFGVVILNLNQEVIQSSVLFSTDTAFENLRCLDVALNNNKYYFGTTNGVYSLGLAQNIMSLANWSKVSTLPNGHYPQVVGYNNRLLAAYSKFYTTGGTIFNEDTLFTLDASDTKDYFDISYRFPVLGLDVNHGSLVIAADSLGYTYGPNGSLTNVVTEPQVYDLRKGTKATDGYTYYADVKVGLIRTGPATENLFFPDGPASTSVYKLDIDRNGDIWLATGGRAIDWNFMFRGDGVYYRRDNDWKSLNIPDFGSGFAHQDIIRILIDPDDPTHVYFISHGTGFYEAKDYVVISQVISPIFPPTPTLLPYKLTGMDRDEEGNIWVANPGTSNALKKLSPDGSWTQVSLAPYVTGSSLTGDVLVDDYGYIWTGVTYSGIVVYNPKNNARQLLNGQFNTGSLPNLYIRTMEKDGNGDVWVGTDDGLCILSPGQLFTGSAINAQKIVLVAEDGNNELLLDNTIITDIAVDGANRKWISTYGNGVRLVSPDGRQILKSFTAENSPLLSNVVECIAIDPTSGEVYFGTDKGLVSYRGDATDASNSFGDVLVFPNPVRPDYEGPIAIRGMAENASVKITDIQGNLVYQTVALGGQAIWNGTRYNGKRAQTGVYLVFCTNRDASETLITKILFVN